MSPNFDAAGKCIWCHQRPPHRDGCPTLAPNPAEPLPPEGPRPEFSMCNHAEGCICTDPTHADCCGTLRPLVLAYIEREAASPAPLDVERFDAPTLRHWMRHDPPAARAGLEEAIRLLGLHLDQFDNVAVDGNLRADTATFLARLTPEPSA